MRGARDGARTRRDGRGRRAIWRTLPPALQFFLLLFAEWVNREQANAFDDLKEENRLLREQLGGRRVRLTDDERRRFAVKGKALNRRLLGEGAGMVTPDTILRWNRRLVAEQYDGSMKRLAGGVLDEDRRDLVEGRGCGCDAAAGDGRALGGSVTNAKRRRTAKSMAAMLRSAVFIGASTWRLVGSESSDCP